ncbi:uncharacterized protein LOC114247363 [Bombyx mandarina]|uniref:Uncharacterized protein LOC114247363 n=1 Tax=Bombyx mandarina TaxID=7092 RepID=A0A6J2K383_BOMMA|nr:uncharacterized protein LOC114247363 [Bombyx mandarina]
MKVAAALFTILQIVNAVPTIAEHDTAPASDAQTGDDLHQEIAEAVLGASQEHDSAKQTDTNVKTVKLGGPILDDLIYQVSAATGNQEKRVSKHLDSFHDTLEKVTDLSSVGNVIKQFGNTVKEDISKSKGILLDKAKAIEKGVSVAKDLLRDKTEEVVKGISEAKYLLSKKGEETLKHIINLGTGIKGKIQDILKNIATSHEVAKEKFNVIVKNFTDALCNIKLPQIDFSTTLALAAEAVTVGISFIAFLGSVIEKEILSKTHNDGSLKNHLESVLDSISKGTLKFGGSDDNNSEKSETSQVDVQSIDVGKSNTVNRDEEKANSGDDVEDNDDDDTSASYEDGSEEVKTITVESSKSAPVQTNQANTEQKSYEAIHPLQQRNSVKVFQTGSEHPHVNVDREAKHYRNYKNIGSQFLSNEPFAYAHSGSNVKAGGYGGSGFVGHGPLTPVQLNSGDNSGIIHTKPETGVHAFAYA